MTATVLAIWIFMTLLGLSAVLALAWAFQSGQFNDLERGARSIFDEEEPVGQMTDHFPDHHRSHNKSEPER